MINPFAPYGPFLYPLETSENLTLEEKKRTKEKEVQQFSVVLRITDWVNWLSVNGKCKTDSYSS